MDPYALPLVSPGNVAEAKEDSCSLGLDEGTDEENRKPLGEDEKVAGNSRSKSSGNTEEEKRTESNKEGKLAERYG